MSAWNVSGNVHRLREHIFLVTGPASNWLIVIDDEWLLIDGGYPQDYELVMDSAKFVGAAGLPAAALLTHAHLDHLGSAVHLATQGVPIWCGISEAANVTGETPSQIEPKTAFAKAERSSLWKGWLHHAVAAGGLDPRRPSRSDLTLFDPTANQPLDLPGAPSALATHGHTPGHTSYVLGDLLAGGDVIITSHPTSTRGIAPQFLDTAFHCDQTQVFAAARKMLATETEILAPGHGPAMSMSEVRAGLVFSEQPH